MIRISDEDAIIRTACGECFIRVQHCGEDDWRYVMLSLLSNHEPWDERGLRRRLERSLEALRGKPGQWFEMLTREEVDGLIEALTVARDAAFSLSDGPPAASELADGAQADPADGFRGHGADRSVASEPADEAQ